MTVLPRLLLGDVEQLVDRTPPISLRAAVHTVWEDRGQTRVRALLTQAPDAPRGTGEPALP